MESSGLPTSKICFIFCIFVGFGLLFFHWSASGNTTEFFLMQFLLCTTMLRWRIQKKVYGSIEMDVIACLIFAPWMVVLPMFSGMYYRSYWVIIGLIFMSDITIGSFALLGGLAGLFLGLWEKEHYNGLKWRDEEASRRYRLETLQQELLTATAQVERMTIISERARIASDIHDNAGHEIIAAHMSLQAMRIVIEEITTKDAEILELYDTALDRLSKGVDRIREAVHNLAPTKILGVELLHLICNKFPMSVKFNMYGDTSKIPIHIWNMLESCLNEALTNVLRHSIPRNINVLLDTTPHIVRLCVENDGVKQVDINRPSMGKGLRNLRNRALAVGGNISILANEKSFKIICVIPIKG